jgi:hypothetical protein
LHPPDGTYTSGVTGTDRYCGRVPEEVIDVNSTKISTKSVFSSCELRETRSGEPPKLHETRSGEPTKLHETRSGEPPKLHETRSGEPPKFSRDRKGDHIHVCTVQSRDILSVKNALLRREMQHHQTSVHALQRLTVFRIAARFSVPIRGHKIASRDIVCSFCYMEVHANWAERLL